VTTASLGTAPDEPSLVGNAALSWAMHAGRAVLSLVTVVFVSRQLGADGRGQVAYVINLSGLLALISTAGTSAAMIRSINLRHSHPRDLYSDGLDNGALCSIVILGACAIVAGRSPDQQIIVWLAGGGAVMLIAHMNLSNAAGLDNRIWRVTWTSLLGVAIYAIGTVVTSSLGTTTVLNNLVLWFAGTVASAVALAAASHDRFARRRPGAIRWFAARSLRSVFASGAVLAIWKIDVVMVRKQRGLTELGLYSVAVGSAEIVLTVAIGVTTALLPSLGSGDDAAGITCRATRVTLAGLVVVCTAVAASASFAVRLVFGSEFAASSTALLCLLPGVVCFVLHFPLFNYVTSRGGTPALSAVAAAGLVVNVVGNGVLLRHFDYRAASIMSSLSYALLFGGCLVLFTRVSGHGVRDLLVPQRRDLDDLLDGVRALTGRSRRR
jgi:O-antigen/teichoic acid export membrane protein